MSVFIFPRALLRGGNQNSGLRAYQIREGDRVTSAMSFTADTDEEALALAREYIDGLDVEV
jgi:hypothetical protein